jgi:hypothetical protein
MFYQHAVIGLDRCTVDDEPMREISASMASKAP